MNIKALCKQAHGNALAHGFYDNYGLPGVNMPGEYHAHLDHAQELAAIARMHSELAEAADADPAGMSVKIPIFRHTTEEFADLLIRIFDWCGYREYDLETHYRGARMDTVVNRASETKTEFGVCRTLPQLIAECHYHLGCATEALRNARSPVPAFAAAASAVTSHYFSFSPDCLDDAVAAKMRYNESRPYKHGKVS